MFCLQNDNARLGNFINLTPALQSIAEHTGEPVPVFFETNYVKECFLDAEFITHLDKRPHKNEIPAIQSIDYKRELYLEPDYQYLWQKYQRQFGYTGSIPHTYVDKPMLSGIADLFGKLAVVSNGSGFYDGKYEHLKLIDTTVFSKLIKKIDMRTVFVGSPEDERHAPRCDYYFTRDIRENLGLISRAQFVITCDGGMMHAAVAMKKPTFILWKNTNSIKSAPPGGYIAMKDYVSEFERWINRRDVTTKDSGHSPELYFPG